MKLYCTKYMLFLALALMLLGTAACTQSKPAVPTQPVSPLETPLAPQAVGTETTPTTLETAPAAVSTEAAPSGNPTQSSNPLPGQTPGQPAPGQTPGQPAPGETPSSGTPEATLAPPPQGSETTQPPTDNQQPPAGQTPVTSQPVAGCPNPYTVQAGEHLYSIARKCGVSATALIAANPGINPNYLYPGQKLYMPGSTTGGTVPSNPPPPSSGGGRTYTVQPGDNLYRISLKFGVSEQAIMAANGISNPNYIYAGQVLVIP